MRSSIVRLSRKVNWRSRMPQSSYYRDEGFSPALYRARRQYLLPNVITGVCVFTFAITVYAYTIHIVAQDEFEDVPIPNAPAQPPQAPQASVTRSAGRTDVGR